MRLMEQVSFKVPQQRSSSQAFSKYQLRATATYLNLVSYKRADGRVTTDYCEKILQRSDQHGPPLQLLRAQLGTSQYYYLSEYSCCD